MKARNSYRIVYLIIGITGLLLQLGVFQGQFHTAALVYYTLLSNILCMVYFSFRVFYDNNPSGKINKFANFIMSIHTKYAVTMCIVLTFLVYHFILAPSIGSRPNLFGTTVISNYILHYIVPLMTIIDFLIFDRCSPKLSWSDPVRWMVIPFVYLVFIIIRAPIAGNIGSTSSPYPYGFIDFTQHPVSGILTNILILVIIFLLLGYIMLFLDFMSRKIYNSLRYK